MPSTPRARVLPYSMCRSCWPQLVGCCEQPIGRNTPRGGACLLAAIGSHSQTPFSSLPCTWQHAPFQCPYPDTYPSPYPHPKPGPIPCPQAYPHPCRVAYRVALPLCPLDSTARTRFYHRSMKPSWNTWRPWIGAKRRPGCGSFGRWKSSTWKAWRACALIMSRWG